MDNEIYFILYILPNHFWILPKIEQNKFSLISFIIIYRYLNQIVFIAVDFIRENKCNLVILSQKKKLI